MGEVLNSGVVTSFLNKSSVSNILDKFYDQKNKIVGDVSNLLASSFGVKSTV